MESTKNNTFFCEYTHLHTIRVAEVNSVRASSWPSTTDFASIVSLYSQHRAYNQEQWENKFATKKSLLDLNGNILIMLMEFYAKYQQDATKKEKILNEAINYFSSRSEHEKLLEVETLYAHAGGKCLKNRSF